MLGKLESQLATLFCRHKEGDGADEEWWGWMVIGCMVYAWGWILCRLTELAGAVYFIGADNKVVIDVLQKLGMLVTIAMVMCVAVDHTIMLHIWGNC